MKSLPAPRIRSSVVASPRALGRCLMRIAPALLIGALLLVPSTSRSQIPSVIQIAANDCPGGPAATSHLIDQCVSDDGLAMELVVSFALPVNIPDVIQMTAELQVITWDPFGEQPLLPDWWRLQPGGCREGAATVDLSAPSGSVCSDLWTGAQPSVTTTFEEVFVDFPLSYLRALVDVAAQPVPIQAGTK